MGFMSPVCVENAQIAQIELQGFKQNYKVSFCTAFMALVPEML